MKITLYNSEDIEVKKEILSQGEKQLYISSLGTIVNDNSNLIIYKASLDQLYNKITLDDEFSKLFKLHLNHGLNLMNDKIDKCNIHLMVSILISFLV